MKERHLVVTRYRWDSRTKKNNAIKRVKALAGIDCEITMYYGNLGVPEVKNGRITHEWYENNISAEAKANGYTHAKFVFSNEDGRRWGLQSGLRGTNLRDSDYFGEAWIKANEFSLRKFENGDTQNEYIKVFLHEDGHEYKNQGFTNLSIHDYDYKTSINNIEQFYIDLKFDIAQQRKVLMHRILDMLKLVYAKLITIQAITLK